MRAKCDNPFSHAVSIGGKCTGSLYDAVNCAAVVPYAAYYYSYTAMKDSSSGPPIGRPMLVTVQEFGIAVDATLDCEKNVVFHNGEAIGDEGRYGSTSPRQFHGKADTYLPGVHDNGGVDLSLNYGHSGVY
jgi:hypothetical protein